MRRRLYAAALQQFDELTSAATQISAASRPLPLYYALTQAGRAIVAAHGSQATVRGHGLKLGQIESDLFKTTVGPDGEREFQVVSDILGSPRLSSPVELGALWSSLPDLWGTPLPAGEWRRALPVIPQRKTVGITITMSRDADAVVELEPFEEAEKREHGAAIAPLSLADVEAALNAYPSASSFSVLVRKEGGVAHAQIGETATGRTTHRGVLVRWIAGGSNESDRLAKIAEVAPEYRFRGEQWRRPGVGPNSELLSPLMAWWALLYALSMLARYQPDEWVKALDIDKSPFAVPIDDALEVALSAIPHLVLEALASRALLIQR